MFTYAKKGELLDFEHRSLKLVFGFIKSAIDRDRTAYEERCRKNAENANKAEKKKKENEKQKGCDMDMKTLINSITPSQ